MTTPNGNMVVVEGATRARWSRRANGSWKLVNIWPDEDEQSLIHKQLQNGDGLLIVMDSVPGILSAFRDEIEDPLLYAAAPPEDCIVEVTIPFLDWLPPRYGFPARLFLDQVREQTADLPAALQPPFILSDSPSSGGNVRFVARTPRSIPTNVSNEHMCALADYVFSSHARRRTTDARRPGSTRWLSILARSITAGRREAVVAGAGTGVNRAV